MFQPYYVEPDPDPGNQKIKIRRNWIHNSKWQEQDEKKDFSANYTEFLGKNVSFFLLQSQCLSECLAEITLKTYSIQARLYPLAPLPKFEFQSSIL